MTGCNDQDAVMMVMAEASSAVVHQPKGVLWWCFCIRLQSKLISNPISCIVEATTAAPPASQEELKARAAANRTRGQTHKMLPQTDAPNCFLTGSSPA
jgi:hypothetical protein